ncbi:Tyrosine recombinase XerD [Bacillus velezensis]|uniref:tyrosine-type recombinase/integrase n=1 Tax=Bacillus velezensis TaxID=492670 RepID=UPI000B9286B3|nr:tyrosine-type recombinase/integrase [Bacillus velezensis]ASS64356.1 Tyrosine recombinase XerD [Bacillus velezensis]ATC49783.1 Tyrosine recombinase XerD [Bacillus velezensis]
MAKNQRNSERNLIFKTRKTSGNQRTFNLAEAIDMYIEDKRLGKRSGKTLKTYSQTLQHFAKFCLDKELTGSEPACVKEYVKFLSFEKTKWDDHPTNKRSQQEIGVSARSANNVIRNLRVFYNWAQKEFGIFEQNPAVMVGYQKEPEQTFEIFTNEDVSKLLSTPNKRTYTGFRDYVMMLILVDTGVRIGELTQTKISDIDLVYRQINLRAETTKAKRSRTLPLSKTTASAISELIEYVNIQDDDDYVFLTQFGERYYGDTFSKMLKKYGKKAGITGARVSPHTFRHYFAVNFLLNGGDPFALMKILGHTDMSMTRRYVNYLNSNVQEMHEKASPVTALMDKGNNRKRGPKMFK